MKLVFTLPGNWTNPWILLRLLEVVESPWRATELGFTNPETGDRASLAYAAAVPQVARVFADSTDPVRPPMDDDLLEQIREHKSIFQLTADFEPARPLQSLRSGLRAANAVVDGGALAIQIGNSGLVHGADAFQALMAGVDAAGEDEDALRSALFQVVARFVLGQQSMTLGMHTLGRPDVVLMEPVAADRAVGRMERLALGTDPANAVDTRELPEVVRNPIGLILDPAPPGL
ncbi:MAG: hypothetical protein H6737_03435 [Alphaproteobacteria bacterium]|nr:hypothetical protein [Alphaproteobacteria bacterium]